MAEANAVLERQSSRPDATKAAELPVALHVGGGSPSHVSPGVGRNRVDLLVESRRALNMAIPSEWDVATSVERRDVTVEPPAGATVRANAVSPVTLIPVREPLITDRQVTCCLLVACIMLAAIVIQLSMGVPLHTVAVTALTYLGGTRGTVEGYHLTQATNGTMVVVQPGGFDPVTVLVGSSLMFTRRWHSRCMRSLSAASTTRCAKSWSARAGEFGAYRGSCSMSSRASDSV